MGLIFFLSQETATESSATSGSLIKLVVNFFFPNISAESLANIVSNMQFIVRKGAHFSLYAVLGALSFLAVITYEKIPLFLRVVISMLIGLVYSASDEFHQTFIAGRSGELRDICIDFSGVFIAVIFCLIVYVIGRSIMKKRGAKMKKKHYIQLCDTLKTELRKAKLEIDDLKESNDFLTRENEDLNSEINRLREIVAKTQSAPDTIKKEEVSEILAKTPQIETDEDDTITENLKEVNVELTADMNLGAEIIGKIVMKSTEYCNLLTVDGNQQAKELVNLILGRTEVAKAEILKIVNMNTDNTTKLNAMKNEEIDAEDYFKSVMAQK